MARLTPWWLLVVVAGCAPSEDGTTDTTDDTDPTDDTDAPVGDRAPPAPEPRIRPASPLAGDELRVVWDDVVDPDGDAVTYAVRWSTDDARATFAARDLTIPGDQVRRGKTWTVEVVAQAGGKSSPVATTSVTVGNGVPVVTGVSVTPTSPSALDALTATAQVSDPEGDALTRTWTWTVDGATVLSGVGANVLVDVPLTRGDVVVATLSVDDGNGGVASAASAPVTVVNTPPSGGRVLMTPRAPSAGEALRCDLVAPAVDVDGDPLTYVWRWTVAGAVVRTSTASAATSDELPAGRTASGDVVLCSATPNDGIADGAPAGDARKADGAVADVYTMTLGGAFSCAMAGDGTTTCWGDDLNRRAISPQERYLLAASGTDFSCGLTPSSELGCWGYNGGPLGRRTDPPAGTFLQVVAAGARACALASDRTVACWGDATGAGTPPEGTFTDVAVGTAHGCALDDAGQAVCWGRNTLGQTDAPTDELRQVRARGDTTCGLRDDGTAVCWGANDVGQATPPAEAFVDIAVGRKHACGIRIGDDALVCWGADDLGQSSPPPGAFVRLWLGDDHGCAQDERDAVVCWGDPIGGVLELPVPDVRAVAVGTAFQCEVNGLGVPVCFGVDGVGAPTAPPPFADLAQLDAGSSHACGLDRQGNVLCWGSNLYGESSPPAGRFEDVTVGFSHSCALEPDGDAVCWGSNGLGESNAPAGVKFTDLDAGTSHTCGTRIAGGVQCWGLNLFGQVGQAPQTGDFLSVSAGGNHSCAIAADGDTVDCWGFSTLGQARDQNEPFLAVSAGEQHTCGIKGDGTLKCWGTGLGGLLQAPDGADFVEISAGLAGTCARDRDGGVWCWGAVRRRPLVWLNP